MIPKFRVWDGEMQQMIWQGDDEYEFYLDETGLRVYDHNVDTFIHVAVMQYTGLLDKNETEVYEGDIVTAWSQGQRGIFEVRWRQETGPCYILYPAWQSDQMWSLHARLNESNGIYYDRGIEVIGSIYENPELMEEVQHD